MTTTAAAFEEAMHQVIERTRGDDGALQQVAAALDSGDFPQIRAVMAQHGGLEICEAQARDFVQWFQARYQADPVTGRYVLER